MSLYRDRLHSYSTFVHNWQTFIVHGYIRLRGATARLIRRLRVRIKSGSYCFGNFCNIQIANIYLGIDRFCLFCVVIRFVFIPATTANDLRLRMMAIPFKKDASSTGLSSNLVKLFNITVVTYIYNYNVISHCPYVGDIVN